MKPKTILCEDCGTPVIATHNKTRFCAECAKKRDKLSRERSKERRRLSKPEVEEEEVIHFCDSPEKIEQCLNCTRPYCTNCLSTPPTRKKKQIQGMDGAHYRDVKNEVLKCYRAGKMLKEVAMEFRVSTNTASRWKKRLKDEGLL